MRCGNCPTTFCQYRRTDGECVFNPFPNGPWDKGYEPADSTKEPDEYMKKMRNALVSSWFGDDAELLSAAQDLVDAVEKYTRQECLRSELMIKKNKLKKLIKGEQER